MAQAYKVVGRAHRRVTTVTQKGVAPDGTVVEVKQNGPLMTCAVGDIIEDIRRDELEAFPDRFLPATSAEVDAWHERQAQLPMVMRAPGLTTEQAQEHAELTKQIAELQEKQQQLLAQAQTPVPTELPPGEQPVGGTFPPPGRRSENVLPGSGIADAPGHHSLPPGMAAPPVEQTQPATPERTKPPEEEPGSRASRGHRS